MGNHELALKVLLDVGIRNRELDRVLASNATLDWFGRTFTGQQKIFDFYYNSSTKYDHTIDGSEATESFEERPAHLETQKCPSENFQSPDATDEMEQWFDCGTHSPVSIKEGHRTPPLTASTPAICPPAPCRYGQKFLPISDDELETDDDDDSDELESGIKQLDTAAIEILKEKKEKSPESKRIRRSDNKEALSSEEQKFPRESKFSDLHYLQASGTIIITRQNSEEKEHRECKLLVSYRIDKQCSQNIQIALIVYKSNSRNTKSRRNLMIEFNKKVADLMSPTLINGPSATSRCRTTAKEYRNPEEIELVCIATAPAGSKTRPVKRPMTSKASLRF